MNYTKFREKNNIDLHLLSFLGILQKGNRIVQLNNFPDYDLSSYDKSSETQYFFRDTWYFADDFSTIIDIKVEDTRVFVNDEIDQLSIEYNIPFSRDEQCDILLNRVREINPHIMGQGEEPNFEGFHLRDVKIQQIDQFRKIVEFFGGYTGSSESIQPIGWSIFVECSFLGFVSGKHYGKFYVDLIAEGYALRDAKNYKLSFFIAFTALENYINDSLYTQNNEGRLKDKLTELFKVQIGSLQKHQIYTSVIGEFGAWEKMRHAVAHGRENIEITKEHVEELMIFILTLICSIERKESSFDGLYAQLPCY